MKLGIMQPYFFPYLGHFALIAAVDEWVVFDIPQYTRKSWINRNRVLHPDCRLAVHFDSARQFIDPYQNIRRANRQYPRPETLRFGQGLTLSEACTVLQRSLRNNSQCIRCSARPESGGTQYRGASFSVPVFGFAVSLPALYRTYLRFSAAASSRRLGPVDRGSAWRGHVYQSHWRAQVVRPVRVCEGRRDIAVSRLYPVRYETPGYKFESNLSILDVMMWNEPDAIVRAIRDQSSVTSLGEEGESRLRPTSCLDLVGPLYS